MEPRPGYGAATGTVVSRYRVGCKCVVGQGDLLCAWVLRADAIGEPIQHPVQGNSRTHASSGTSHGPWRFVGSGTPTPGAAPTRSPPTATGIPRSGWWSNPGPGSSGDSWSRSRTARDTDDEPTTRAGPPTPRQVRVAFQPANAYTRKPAPPLALPHEYPAAGRDRLARLLRHPRDGRQRPAGLGVARVAAIGPAALAAQTA